ncbi:MAG: phospholipase D-like domain-containing protein, partial [Bdellovibrionales bacterium]
SSLFLSSAQSAPLCRKVVSPPPIKKVDLSKKSLKQESSIWDSAEVVFKEKFRILKQAQFSILISTFSIKPDAWYARDEIGKTLADILIEKHRAGVEVKVFTDYWGNPLSTRAEVNRMIKAGVDVRYFGAPQNFFEMLVMIYKAIREKNGTQLNHGKTMIVDGWQASTGGYNWMLGTTDNIKAWRDTDIYIAGPIAQKMSEDFYWIFDQLKKTSKGPEGHRVEFNYTKEESQYRDEFYTQAPWMDQGRTPINDRILELIGSSEKGDEIFWQSFSFRVQPPHLAALKKAAERGVKISILSNSRENLLKQLFFILIPQVRKHIAEHLYQAATESYAPLLSLAADNPARVYEYEGQEGPMHAKAFLLIKNGEFISGSKQKKSEEQIADSNELESEGVQKGVVGVGTYNVSPNSWDQHVETMVFSNRENLVRDLHETYKKDLKLSREIKQWPE